jgi:regulatory protein
LLTQREHSRAELARKLARHRARESESAPESESDPQAPQMPDGEPEAEPENDPATLHSELQRTLDELERRGLLSDRRAAGALLHAKAGRCGSRRLQQLMQARSFAPELVAETLAQVRGSEYERALDIWRRRFGAPAQDPKERARQHRFLAGRGFDPEVIARVLRNSGGTDDDGA